MDIIVNAAIQSPLVRTLSATQGKGNTFTHRIKDNIPPVSFGKLELAPDGGAQGTYNRNYKFRIPQYGYWRSFILKFQGSENGLGNALIGDIYASLTTNPQVTRFYGDSDADNEIFTQYLKADLFGSFRNAYGTTPPNSQSFVPQGWVSPFDGNVRSGNYDPWESMWIRLVGGNTYGNQANTGTYPNPVPELPIGDARIAPFRHTPRFDALNSFGRNTHCTGNELYDPGHVGGGNVLEPGACGYCIKTGVTGDSVLSFSNFTTVNDVVVTPTIDSNTYLTNTSTLANVPKGSSAVANNLPGNVTNGQGAPGAGALGVFVPNTLMTTNLSNTIVSTNTFDAAITGQSAVSTRVPQSTLGWANDSQVLRTGTIGGSGAGENVAFGMQIVRDGVPYGTTISAGGQFPFSAGTWAYVNNVPTSASTNANSNVANSISVAWSQISGVPIGATLSDTSGNQDIYFGQRTLNDANYKTAIMYASDGFSNYNVNLLGTNYAPTDTTSNGWFTDGQVVQYFGTGGRHGGVPHDCTGVSNTMAHTTGSFGNITNVLSGTTLTANVLSSSTSSLINVVQVPFNAAGVVNGVAGGNGGSVNLRANIPYNVTYVGGGSGNPVPWTSGTITDLLNVNAGGTARTGVPYGGTNPTGVPINQTMTRIALFVDMTNAANRISGVPNGCTLDSTVMSTTGSVARTGIPYGSSTVDNMLQSTGNTQDSRASDNLNVSGQLDWSYLVPFDGCMFHQVPIYNATVDAPAFFYLQPDGQYSAANAAQGGSRGYAASTPPIYNTNTQMRNRYLGQRLASTYDWCSQANLSRYLGALMIDKVTLSTHNRIIQTIYPVETMARIYRMPMDQKRKWLSLIRPHITASPSSIGQGMTQTPGYTGGVDSRDVPWQRSAEDAFGTYRQFVCYFPCFFSFFDDPGNNVDTRFVENIDVDVYVQPVSNIYDPCDLGISSNNLGTIYNFNDTTQDDRAVMTTYTGFHSQEFRQRVSVINQSVLTVSALCYYHNFHDSTSQSIRDYNYKPNVPANILSYNTYAEAPTPISAANIVQGGIINVNLSCANLTQDIVFCIRRVQKNVSAFPQLASFPFESFMTTLPVKTISLTGSGQLIYQGTGVECMLADQWDYSMNNIQSGKSLTNDSGLYADSHESYYAQSKPTCDGFFGYRIPFSFSQDRTYNSGCLALQTINNPVLSIELFPLHGWVINDDNLACRMGSLFNLSENLNQRECDTQTVFDGDFQLEVFENYFQLVRIDSNTGTMTKSIDI